MANTTTFGNKPQPGDTIRYTTCSEHCFNVCILKVHIREGKIWAVEPDDTINPGVAREDGHVPDEMIDKCMITARPCTKGYAHIRNLYSPDRLMYPVKRIGERGEGKWQRISWEEALDTIADKLKYYKKEYGPFSIGDDWNDFPLSKWFGAGVADWGIHSKNGIDEPERWVMGSDGRGDRQDESNLLQSKLIVLWGFNPATTLSNHVVYTLMRARERGIPIISIEPRYTPTAETVASQWIPIRPTTDVAMMIAMANVWFKEDLCDNEFVKKWVEPDGVRRWQEYVLGTKDRVDKTPQWAEKICGVPAQTITEFARLYARSKPVNLNTAWSLGRQFFGENGIRAGMYLQALTGNTMSPGATASSDSAGEFGVHESSLPKPFVDWQRAPATYQAPILLAHFKWPEAIVLREKLDKGEMTVEEYNRIIGNPPGNPPPNIKIIIISGSNPLMTHPDVNTNIKAFKKLGFIAVFSYHLDNPSARYADIVLPQMHKAFEGRDSCFGTGGGTRDSFVSMPTNLNGNYFVYKQKCVDQPGEIKSAGWIWVQIARRIGIAEQFSPLLANVPDEKWDETIEKLHREAYEKWASMAEIVPYNPPTWEEFQKKPIFRWQVDEPYYTYKDAITHGRNPFSRTESGKIEFYSRELAAGLAKTKFNKDGKSAISGRKMHAVNGRYGGGNLTPMAEMTMGGKATYHSQDTVKYPLLMSSPHSLYRIHSLLDNQPLLRDCYRHAVWISTADAKARGIADNDPVRVYNDQAEIVMPAYVTSKAVPGTVNIFHGGWYTPGKTKTTLMPEGIDTRGAPNLMTHYDEQPLPETILDHEPCKALVQIEKWAGATA
ncbi:MAG: molybdopterin-dependent oxidoreductase [Dehalococcoidales bacterium]